MPALAPALFWVGLVGRDHQWPGHHAPVFKAPRVGVTGMTPGDDTGGASTAEAEAGVPDEAAVAVEPGSGGGGGKGCPGVGLCAALALERLIQAAKAPAKAIWTGAWVSCPQTRLPTWLRQGATRCCTGCQPQGRRATRAAPVAAAAPRQTQGWRRTMGFAWWTKVEPTSSTEAYQGCLPSQSVAAPVNACHVPLPRPCCSIWVASEIEKGVPGAALFALPAGPCGACFFERPGPLGESVRMSWVRDASMRCRARATRCSAVAFAGVELGWVILRPEF
jgi:hypothetical protein